MDDDGLATRFVDDGFVKIEGAFPPRVAEDCARLLWRETRYDPDDPGTGEIGPRRDHPVLRAQVGSSGVMPVLAFSSGASDRTVTGSLALTACQAIAASCATGHSAFGAWVRPASSRSEAVAVLAQEMLRTPGGLLTRPQSVSVRSAGRNVSMASSATVTSIGVL